MASSTSHPSTARAGGTDVPPAIECVGLNKSFGPVRANRDVSLWVAPGTIHGIVGENGAGKSTLMALLYGFYQADSGRIRVHGEDVAIKSPAHAIRHGIGMVHQHFMLVEPFTVLENVILGAEDARRIRPSLERARAEVERLGRDYGLEVDPDAVVGDLPVGLQQRVEILKALYRGAKILILDEPTGVLTPQEADHLFRILATLRDQGTTVLLITHKLREIMAATDVVSVMRQGAMVAHRTTSKTSSEELAELMVGRKVLLRVDKGPAEPGDEVLRVDGLGYTDEHGVRRLKDVGFTARRGEIVGIAGVSGNGQSELLQVLAGVASPTAGRVLVNGEEVAAPGRTVGPQALHGLGVAHVAEDRQRMGMVMDFSAAENAVLGYHRAPDLGRGPQLDPGRMAARCEKRMHRYDIRPARPGLPASGFSGGNQQKLVLAREMEADPDLLLVGQPTRGVDIGAIEFIHRRIVAMRDAGKAVVLVSVELDEILSLSDRILVMYDGRVVGEVTAGEVAAQEATEAMLGLMMAGATPECARMEAVESETGEDS